MIMVHLKITHDSGIKMNSTLSLKITHDSGIKMNSTLSLKITHDSWINMNSTLSLKITHDSGIKMNSTLSLNKMYKNLQWISKIIKISIQLKKCVSVCANNPGLVDPFEGVRLFVNSRKSNRVSQEFLHAKFGATKLGLDWVRTSYSRRY